MNRLDKYLPYHVSSLDEFSSIDKTVSAELDNIDSITRDVEDNQFIHTANDRGLTRYEKMHSIASIGDIPTRRMNILNIYNTNANYTMKWLRQYLATLVGEGEFLLMLNNLHLVVSITTSNAHLKDKIQKDLREKLPANIDLTVNLLATNNVDVYAGFIHRSADKLNY